MKTTSKIIVGILVIIVISMIGIFSYVYTSLDSLVEAAIEKYGSQVTQTSVAVDKVKIELVQGQGAIAGIRIANPKGFSEPDAFSLGEISTQIDIKSVTKQPVIISKVVINQPAIFYEMDQEGKDNLSQLKKNISSSTRKTKQEQVKKAPDGKKETEKEAKLVIQHFLIKDGKLKATIMPLDGKVIEAKLPVIEFKNLGGKGGATAKELTQQVLDRIVEVAKTEVKKMGIEKQLEKEVKKRVEKKVDKELDKHLGPDNQEAKDALKQLLEN